MTEQPLQETVSAEENLLSEDALENGLIASDLSVALEEPSAEERPSGPSSFQPEVSVPSPIDQLRTTIETLRRELAELAEAETEQASTRDLLEAQREAVLESQDDFVHWVDLRHSSYAWKLQQQLEVYRAKMSVDEAAVRQFTAEENLLEFGFGEKTRNWFMRQFLRNFFITNGALAVIFLLRKYANQILDAIFNSFSSESFRTFLMSLVYDIVGPWFWRIVGAAFGLSLAHFIALLFAYSRRMSEYSRHVQVESQRSKAMSEGVHQVREGRERLDSLYPQVIQVIDLISHGLHHPWKVDEVHRNFKSRLPDASRLPASLDLSVPSISEHSALYEELVAKAMNEIQVPGWREEAFNIGMNRMANALGFGANGMAVRELEEDQRRSGKRQLIISGAAGDAPLYVYGSELLEKFTAIIQERVVPTVQLEVTSLKPDPLGDLELTGSLLPHEESGSLWETKLAEVAGHAAPWSSGTFSTAGAAAKKHLTLESVFIGSDRVSRLAVSGVESHAEVHPGSRPFDVSIRVDLSQWCKPNEVAIFEDYEPTPDQLSRWQTGTSGTYDHAFEQPEATAAKDASILF